MEFKDKARIVAEQYDKWGLPIALLSKGENIYDLIERLYNALVKHPVEGKETYNQWIARVAADGYAHYKQKMADRPLSKEERERRYQEHKNKFLGK